MPSDGKTALTIKNFSQKNLPFYGKMSLFTAPDTSVLLNKLDIHDKDDADLNALHPFREGNGRSQREFAREICLKCGYGFDLRHTNYEEMLSASIESLDREVMPAWKPSSGNVSRRCLSSHYS